MAKIKNHQKGSLLKNEDMLNIFFDDEDAEEIFDELFARKAITLP